MKPLYLFRHIACNKRGFLCHYLQQRQVPYELICVKPGDRLGCELEATSGLIFLGAPHSVNKPENWISDEIRLIQSAAVSGLPVMGVCFGGQLISRALGGDVITSKHMQIGWHPVTTTGEGRALLSGAGVPADFHVFEWHAESFSLPAGAVPLFYDRNGNNQGFILGNCLAMQFHLEVTRELIEDSLKRFADCLPSPNFSVQSSEQMRAEISSHLAAMHRVAERIYGWWLDKYVFSEFDARPLAVGSQTQDNSP